MVQSYEKSRAEQKILIFFMSRQRNFAVLTAKVRKILQTNGSFTLFCIFVIKNGITGYHRTAHTEILVSFARRGVKLKRLVELTLFKEEQKV